MKGTGRLINPGARILSLLHAHSEARPGVGLERAIHYTEFFRKKAWRYRSRPKQMAEALRYHLARRSIEIYEGERIIGTHTEHRVGAICQVELTGLVMLEDLFRFPRRKTNPLYVDPRQRLRVLFDVVPFWFTKYLVMKAFSFRDRIFYVLSQLKAKQFIINEAGGIAHFLPHYEDLLARGTEGLRRRINQSLEIHKGGLEADNLEAQLVALESVELFADRYRVLASERGRDDLLSAINVRQPAQTLHQALQMIWFFQMIIQIESLDQGISFGRIDQYLLPFYQREVDAGRSQEATELLMAFFIKTAEVIPLFSERITQYFSGLPTGQAVTLGGLTGSGKCAANALTYLLLDMITHLPLRQPNWHARLNAESDARYIERVAETLAQGTASPALYNDDAIIPALKKAGFPERHLWNYATVGCVEPALPGISFTSSDAALVNIAYPVWQLMSRERPAYRLSRAPASLPPLESIQDMDNLISVYRDLLSEQLDELEYCLVRIEQANASEHPTPFSSLLVEGCIESGRDSTQGGARFNASGIQAVGFADVVDSLYAIDALVFRDRWLSLPAFGRAVRANFRGQDALLQKIQSLPRYGHDNDDVDRFAEIIASLYADLITQRKNTRGGRWIPGIYSMTCHRGFGQHLGALPSGRRAGEGLANGIAPSDGMDRIGPTASLNSVSAFSHADYANGVNLNLKLQALGYDSEPLILQRLVEGYFKRGGMQLQLNMMNTDQLVDAMRNPEKHRNLLVRVSGYSAYFVDLSPQMQREILERMTHRLGP